MASPGFELPVAICAASGLLLAVDFIHGNKSTLVGAALCERSPSSGGLLPLVRLPLPRWI